MKRLLGLLCAALLAFAPTVAAASVTTTGAGKKPGGVSSAALDLQFASGTYAKAGTGYGSLSAVPGASLTTPGTFAVNSGGGLVAVSANVGRVGTAGLLVEEASANIEVNTDNFGAGTWTLQGTTFVRTTGFATAPDGTSTAARFQTSTNNDGIKQTPTGGANTYTVSGYLKSNTGSTQNPHWYLNGDNTLTVTTAWQQLVVTNVAAPDWNYYVQTASGVATDVLAWGPQVEQKGFATSYIPNTAGTGSASRAADNALVTLSAPAGAFEIDVGFTTTRSVGQARTLADWNDGTDNNKIILTMDSTNHVVATVINGGTPTTIATEGGTPAATRTATAALLWDGAANWTLKINGSTVATTAASKPTVTAVQIGQNRAITQAMNDLITSLTVH